MASGEQPQIVQIAISPVPIAAPLCRRLVTDALRRWGLEDLIDDAQVVATELVTNAIATSAPADSDVALRLRRERSSLVVEVGDQAEAVPVLQQAAFSVEYGRALSVVTSLSTFWGLRQGAGGTVMWAELPTAA
ncbi:ATP-binding protein [Streptomyces sp. PanSC9]|uniref:ATP-binding protein n=1 Tax=Streptomyces sp. PanSC9 TaxID=1520461 RepID=UPI000FA49179|nr:ATP-binding protein [Streptomyces sp. PanSC9]ROP46801.1 histidine kinase-like protein [Streptomyces sp. PanSC9]